MIAYFDTSAFVKLVVEEPGSQEVAGVWAGADAALSSSSLYPEGRAALAAARRLGRLRPRVAEAARRAFEAYVAQVQRIVADDALLARAGDLAEEQALRGYDAVHLASAEAVGGAHTVVLTADGKLRDAASRLGLAVADFPT